MRLGQHFLKNKKYLKEIVEALELKDNDVIIEIGAGHGELTNIIIEKLKDSKIKRFKLIAIEKDQSLVKSLQKNFACNKNIEIIEGDVLKIIPEINNLAILQSCNYKYKLVGNIPYYITGYLFRILANLDRKPILIVLTIQKEVAKRLCAKPPKMNILSASVNFWANTEIIDYIPKSAFQPQPKVDSAIIKLIPKSCILDPKSYYSFIKALFKQPRKTILNNLREAKIIDLNNCREKLLKLNINPNSRPQDLAIEQIIKLSTLF